jgi:Initiator Replication protein
MQPPRPRLPPRPGTPPEPRPLRLVLPTPPRAPAPVAAPPMPTIKDPAGDFRSFRDAVVKIPLRIVFADQQTLSVTGWKMMAFLMMLGAVSQGREVTVPIADVQLYLGGRITPAAVRQEFQALTSATFEIDGRLQEVVHSTGDSLTTLSFYMSHEFYADDQYSLIDLRDIRKFKKVPHIRAYILFRYQSRLKNNIRLITPDDARWVFGAPEGKRWANVKQDHIKPVVFAIEAVAGLYIKVDIEYAKTKGNPVRGLKLTAGSRFKTRAHHIYARAERAGRQGRKDKAEFEAKLDAAIAAFDPAFLSRAKARYDVATGTATFSDIVAHVRYRAILDWCDVYHADRRRALDYSDDGQFAAALMAYIEKLASNAEAHRAQRDREDLERAAKELAREQTPERIALRAFEDEWDRQVAEQVAKDKLIGTDEYQDNLFDDLPTVRKRDKFLDI